MENVPLLATVTNTFGRKTSQQYVRLLLTDLFDYTEQPQGVTPSRIDEAADLIVTNYYYLNLLELLLFFAECKMAVYGTFFGVTGPMQVANMLNKFCAARATSIQIEEDQKHRQRKSEPSKNEFHEYLALKQRALAGDKDAQREIEDLINLKE